MVLASGPVTTQQPQQQQQHTVSRGENIDEFLAMLDSMTLDDNLVPPATTEEKPQSSAQTADPCRSGVPWLPSAAVRVSPGSPR